MSFQIDTAFVKQYHSSIERLLQQQGSVFLGKTRQETQHSEEQFWEQVDAVEANEVTTRHGDSPQNDTPHERRRAVLRTFDIGDLIDDIDKVKMLIDPTSTYVQNFVDALNRKRDDVIIESFFGTAYKGKAGTTAVTFPAGQQIAVNFGGSNIGLTVEKLREARRLMLVGLNNPQREPWQIAVDAKALDNLLGTTQITSVDYNTVKALVDGTIMRFLGFDFVHTERLQLDASGHRRIPVWAKSGILHVVGKDIQTRVAERGDKRFSMYAYALAMFGATRMEEEKVVEIKCLV